MPTPPVFNLSFDVWYPGHSAQVDPPDKLALGQLYIGPKPSIDVTPGSPNLWFPPSIIRVSMSDYALIPLPLVNTQWGYTDAALRVWYYVVRYWDLAHSGFPNAYLMLLCDQCDASRTVPDPRR